jgi:hypothetical protein
LARRQPKKQMRVQAKRKAPLALIAARARAAFPPQTQKGRREAGLSENFQSDANQ